MMRTPFVTVLLLLVACSHSPVAKRSLQSVVPAEIENDARFTALRTQALSFYRQADYPRVIPVYELMANWNESALSTNDRFALGYSYLALGEGKNAEAHIRKGLRLSPYQPIGYQLLGIAELLQGKPGPAAEHFKKGLEFESHPPKTHYYLAVAYEKMGNTKERDKEFKKAEEEYEKILQQNVYDFGANYELAYLRLTLGHSTLAADELLENARQGLKDSDPELLEGGTLYTQFYLPLLSGLDAFRKNEVEKAVGALQQSALMSPPGSRTDLAEAFRFLAVMEKTRGAEPMAVAYGELSKKLDPVGLVPELKSYPKFE